MQITVVANVYSRAIILVSRPTLVPRLI